MSEYAELVDVDDDDNTLAYTQYAQVGQAHSLGDEVRELRKKVQELEVKVKVQRGTIMYWQNQYCNLSGWVNRLLCLYGWAGDPLLSQHDAICRVRRDIEALRKRVHDLKRQARDGKVWAKYGQDWVDYWQRTTGRDQRS